MISFIGIVIVKALIFSFFEFEIVKHLRVIFRENQAKMEIFGMCDVTEFNEIWG